LQNHDDGALDLGRAQLLVFSRPICIIFQDLFFNIYKGVAPFTWKFMWNQKIYIISPIALLLVI
jgi:hypothetical protein